MSTDCQINIDVNLDLSPVNVAAQLALFNVGSFGVLSINGADGVVILNLADINDTSVTGSQLDADNAKLALIEALADVTDEANVVSALDGATLSDIGTPTASDKVLIQDADDSDNLKSVLVSELTANIFDQDLNTTDSPTFNDLTLTNQLATTDNSVITRGLGDARYSSIALYGARVSNSLNNQQTIPTATFTRLDTVFDVEDYDTDGVMDLANGRFQPDIAGYYNVSAIWITNVIGAGIQITALYKNDVIYSVIGRGAIASGVVNGFGGSDTVYLNGGSDYIEIFAYQSSGISATTLINAGYNRFSATLTGE